MRVLLFGDGLELWAQRKQQEQLGGGQRQANTSELGIRFLGSMNILTLAVAALLLGHLLTPKQALPECYPNEAATN